MFGSTLSFNSLLSGSHTNFRERVHPDAANEEFQKLQREKDRTIGQGIDCLRKIRAEIFGSTDPKHQQTLLKSGYQLADELADYCLADSLDRAAALKEHSYHQVRERIAVPLTEVEPQSKHHIVPSQVSHNLRKAAQDMLLRTEDLIKSLVLPTRRLTDIEVMEVLREFTVGTNDLSINARNALFSPATKVAGLLSGGLVYALMAKKVAERYGCGSGTEISVIAAAVATEEKQAIFEQSSTDSQLSSLVIVDDMIDSGGSILCAANAAEDVFIGADIFCGLRTSLAKGRIPPSQKEHLDHLAYLFQDFADLTEEGKLQEAREMLIDAHAYATGNGVTLQRGWYSRAARFFEDSKTLVGEIPEE